MMRIDDLVASFARLQRRDLEDWIREELVEPHREAEALVFSDMDCARVRLLYSLRYELEVEPDTLPVVMSLVDQLYEARRRLLSLTAAVAAQDGAVQQAILARVSEPDPERDDRQAG